MICKECGKYKKELEYEVFEEQIFMTISFGLFCIAIGILFGWLLL